MGSLASCTSKDSSLKAPGYFGALVATVTYVDHNGQASLLWPPRPCTAKRCTLGGSHHMACVLHAAGCMAC